MKSLALCALIICAAVFASSASAFSAPPGVTFTASNTDCDGHGGVVDAILNEERQIGDNIWVVSGVRCADGTEFLYDQVLLGPATPPAQPADAGSGVGLIDESQPTDSPPDAQPADDGGGGCIPDDTDWMNGGCG